MWNEALESVRAVDVDSGVEGFLRRTPGGGPGLAALLPYEALFSGDERWLEMFVAFAGVPVTARLRAEYQRLAARWLAGAQRREAEASAVDAELKEYVESQRDRELEHWALARMERQLEELRGAAVPLREGEDEPPLSAQEVKEREREREDLLAEMRRPGQRGEDELEVLERRYVEQAGELARRGELARQGERLHEGPRVKGGRPRVTFLLPHQRATTGGVYVIEQFARHMAGEAEVCVAVRERPSRSIPGVEMRWLEQLHVGALPRADVLVYPADMRDAQELLKLPADVVGRPVMLFQGYGTPGSPVVQANLAQAKEAVTIARWLHEVAIEAGVPCAYVPEGLDQLVFSRGPTQQARSKQVSVMTHHLDWKGVGDALEAVELARARHPDLQVALFGTEPMRSEEGTFLESPSRVEVAALLRESAVHVVASWEEGFGLSGAEAIACGAALASTDTKGSRDYAIDGRTALVSAPRDPGGLARNVVRLLDDVALRARLVAAGQRQLRITMPPWPEAARRMRWALLER
jgi:glycosyltransferase involved in cell wall biosynthesis